MTCVFILLRQDKTPVPLFILSIVVSCLNVYYIRCCLLKIHLEGEENKVGVRRSNIFVTLILQPVQGALIPKASTTLQGKSMYMSRTLFSAATCFSVIVTLALPDVFMCVSCLRLVYGVAERNLLETENRGFCVIHE